MNDKVQDALNAQLNAELYSSYLYLSMAAYFESTNLAGFANWMNVQAQEELMHAMKFYDYINERGGRVILKQIEGPPSIWDSPKVAFEHVLKHERKVTSLINSLVDLSMLEKDHATYNFMQWFVSEQVEEESSAETVLNKLKLVGSDGSGILMLDQELGARVFTPPATDSQAKE
jgi:ferritin